METGVERKAKEEMKNMENLENSVGCSGLDFGVKKKSWNTLLEDIARRALARRRRNWVASDGGI